MIRPFIMAVALAGLAACGSAPAPRQAASETALHGIGARNDDAALKAAAEQRGRAQAENDVRDAERREAARASAGPGDGK